MKTNQDGISEVESTEVSMKEENKEANNIEKENNNFNIKFNINLNKKKLSIIGGVLLFIMLLLTVGYLLKVDSYIFPSHLSGVVYDVNGKTIEDVQICINETCKKTNKKGNFSLNNLKRGRNTIKISKDTYKTLKKEIVLQRSNNTQDFTLSFENTGTVKGKLFTKTSEEVNIDELKVFAGESELKINNDLTFEGKSIPVGETSIEIQSPYYIDKKKKILVKEDEDVTVELELVPASDIKINLKNWLNDLEVKDYKVEFNSKNYESKNSSFLIKDIITAEIHNNKLSIVKDNFNTLTLEISDLKIGENLYDDLKIVPTGKVVYLSTRSGSSSVYVSNYDGSNEIELTGSEGEEISPEISEDGTKVYFLSDREKVKNKYNNNVLHLFSVPIQGGNIEKISQTNYEETNGYIGKYNIKSNLRVFSTNDNYPKSEIYISNIDGTSSKLIASLDEGNVDNLKISNGGEFILYSLSDYQNNSIPGLYYVNLKTLENKKLFDLGTSEALSITDLSADDNYALIYVRDNTNTYNLWKVGIFDSVREKVTDNSATENFSSILKSNKKVVYISVRDNKRDVYITGFDDKREEKKLTNHEKVQSVYEDINGNLIFVGDNALWIIDPSYTNTAKKITDNVIENNVYPFY